METILISTLLLSAIYCLFLSFAMKTENLPSAIFFKIFPFILGVACIICIGYEMGFIIKF